MRSLYCKLCGQLFLKRHFSLTRGKRLIAIWVVLALWPIPLELFKVLVELANRTNLYNYLQNLHEIIHLSSKLQTSIPMSTWMSTIFYYS